MTNAIPCMVLHIYGFISLVLNCLNAEQEKSLFSCLKFFIHSEKMYTKMWTEATFIRVFFFFSGLVWFGFDD